MKTNCFHHRPVEFHNGSRSNAPGITRSNPLFRAFLVFPLLSLGVSAAHADITVNYTIGSSLQSDPQSALIQAAFQRAASNWTGVFSNTFTFNLTIDFASLGGNTLGVTLPNRSYYDYSAFRTSLLAGVTSADDAAAVATLASGSTYTRLINRTLDNPNGSASATPYVDSSATKVRIASPLAKALGLVASNSTATDATVRFSSDFRNSFDFNPDDGINANQFDFVAIATHEIGHALGFLSGIDTLENNTPPQDVAVNAADIGYTTPLDFFRYSDLSAQTAGGIIDFTSDMRPKYFTLDKSPTSTLFSTGQYFGDGQQASHWKDDTFTGSNIGIMDPTFARGVGESITTNDLRAFDVIGYNLKPTVGAAPEPASALLLLPTFAALVLRRRTLARKS